MERRFALPLFALLGLAALARPPVSRAAGEILAPGTITTFAGNGQNAATGDGGPAAKAAVGTALWMTFDAAGNLFVAATGDIDRVRRISTAGIITTVAGSGREAFSGDGGPATSAGMAPVAVLVDPDENLYISDYGSSISSRIRKVNASGTITTFAGGGHPADGVGDGGPATSAHLNGPGGTAMDASGNLFIPDSRNHRVRMVTPAGTITTVAGTGTAGFAGDGGPATAAQLDLPFTVVVDSAGRLFIADLGNHRVRMVSPDGTINTVAGGGNPADSVGDGGLATDARLNTPVGLALDGAGNLFIADSRDGRIRRVGPVGIISTIAGTGKAGFSGDGGPATQAELSGPFGLAMDKAGNLFFSDRGLITPDGNNIVGADNQRIREVVGAGVPR
jgi:sugar lactone lactonase YvrE